MTGYICLYQKFNLKNRLIHISQLLIFTVAEYLRTLGPEIRDILEVVANGYLRLCVKQINIKVTQKCVRRTQD